MSVFKFDPSFRGLEWRKAFASRLIELRPDMNPDAADEVSDSEFLQSSSFSPLDAADRYADSGSEPAKADGAAGADPLDRQATPRPRRG